jgi:hypothetical protein
MLQQLTQDATPVTRATSAALPASASPKPLVGACIGALLQHWAVNAQNTGVLIHGSAHAWCQT